MPDPKDLGFDAHREIALNFSIPLVLFSTLPFVVIAYLYYAAFCYRKRLCVGTALFFVQVALWIIDPWGFNEWIWD